MGLLIDNTLSVEKIENFIKKECEEQNEVYFVLDDEYCVTPKLNAYIIEPSSFTFSFTAFRGLNGLSIPDEIEDYRLHEISRILMEIVVRDYL